MVAMAIGLGCVGWSGEKRRSQFTRREEGNKGILGGEVVVSLFFGICRLCLVQAVESTACLH